MLEKLNNSVAPEIVCNSIIKNQIEDAGSNNADSGYKNAQRHCFKNIFHTAAAGKISYNEGNAYACD